LIKEMQSLGLDVRLDTARKPLPASV